MAVSILEEIVRNKREEVAARKNTMRLSFLKERIARRAAARDFAAAIKGDGIKLIAEVKKASPSKGVIVQNFDPVAIASAYARGGAAAISVLTEEKHFQGKLEYLGNIREKVKLPLLRKDFIFDEYQVYESAAYGADALLLIAAILEKKKLKDFVSLGHSLGLACLVETHNDREVAKALESGAEIIGINNRDLNTFRTNIDTTLRLRPLIPDGKIIVSESGISTREDVIKLQTWGVNAVLIGEALVTAPDIAIKIQEMML